VIDEDLHGRVHRGAYAASSAVVNGLGRIFTRAGDGNLQAVPTFTHQLVVGVGRQLCPCSLVTATPQSFTVTSRPAT